MANNLIEKMARDISLAIWEIDYTPLDPCVADVRYLLARKAARAILSLLSDPANITPEMVTRFSEAFDDPKLPGETTHEQAIKIGIAAAFSERAP